MYQKYCNSFNFASKKEPDSANFQYLYCMETTEKKPYKSVETRIFGALFAEFEREEKITITQADLLAGFEGFKSIHEILSEKQESNISFE